MRGRNAIGVALRHPDACTIGSDQVAVLGRRILDKPGDAARCRELGLGACSGVFDSDLAAPQSYVLRVPPAPTPDLVSGSGSILVQRPEAGPLRSDLPADQRQPGQSQGREA